MTTTNPETSEEPLTASDLAAIAIEQLDKFGPLLNVIAAVCDTRLADDGEALDDALTDLLNALPEGRERDDVDFALHGLRMLLGGSARGLDDVRQVLEQLAEGADRA